MKITDQNVCLTREIQWEGGVISKSTYDFSPEIYLTWEFLFLFLISEELNNYKICSPENISRFELVNACAVVSEEPEGRSSKWQSWISWHLSVARRSTLWTLYKHLSGLKLYTCCSFVYLYKKSDCFWLNVHFWSKYHKFHYSFFPSTVRILSAGWALF